MQKISIKFALEAEKLLAEQQYNEAIRLCERGLEIYPDYSSAAILLAKACFFHGEIDRAKEVIDVACYQFPANVAIAQIKDKIYNHSLIQEDSAGNIFQEENSFEIVDNHNDNEDDFSLHIEEIKNLTNKLKQVSQESIDSENSAEMTGISNFFEIKSEDETYNIPDAENNLADDGMSLESMENADDIIEQDTENTDSYEIEKNDAETYFPENILTEFAVDTLDETKGDNDENDAMEVESVENTNVEKIEYFDEYEKNIFAKAFRKSKNIPQDNSNKISKLYQIDLKFPREKSNIKIQPDVFENIKLDMDFSKADFFNFGVVDDEEKLKNIHNPDELIDEKAQEFLNLSKQLENAQVTLAEESYDDQEPDSEDTPLVASETMAKIFTKQKAYKQAIKIYEMLIEEKPEKADFYHEQIEILTKVNNP